MFVIDLHYVASLEQIDAHMGAHMKFLNKYYKAGVFVASGRKVPRTGGVILAKGKTKEEIELLVREDPFHQHGLAEFRITEFQTSQVHPDFKGLLP